LTKATAVKLTHVAVFTIFIRPPAQDSLHSVILVQGHCKLLSISQWEYSPSQNAKGY